MRSWRNCRIWYCNPPVRKKKGLSAYADYLKTAVIKESLRMGNGVVAPLPRFTPEPGVVISGELIPAGVNYYSPPFFLFLIS